MIILNMKRNKFWLILGSKTKKASFKEGNADAGNLLVKNCWKGIFKMSHEEKVNELMM